MPPAAARSDDRPVLTLTRRLAPVLLAGLLLVPLAGTAAAATPEPVTEAVLTQSGLDLVTLTNRQREALGLVHLRIDPDLMAIARDRADVMAANDVMSHTEPNGQKVFDRLGAAGLTWYGAGEIIAWNNYPTEPLSVAESIRAWMASPGHHDIMVSTGYNYIGFGAAVSATGLRYYAGVFVKEPDQTGAWAHFGTVSKHSRLRTSCPRDAPLVRRRHPAPGAHGGPSLLRGPAASGRREVVLLGRHDLDQPDRHLVAPYDHQVRVQGSRQGRQLGRLAGHPHQPLTPARPEGDCPRPRPHPHYPPWRDVEGLASVS